METKNEREKSITANPLAIKPYALSVKVAPEVSNKKIMRMVFLHCEPPRMLFKDNEVTHFLARSMNVLVVFSFFFFKLFVY